MGDPELEVAPARKADTQAPSVESEFPAEGGTFQQSFINISGTVADDDPVETITVKVFGKQQRGGHIPLRQGMAMQMEDTRWAFPFSLQELAPSGRYRAVVVSTDGARKQSKARTVNSAVDVADTTAGLIVLDDFEAGVTPGWRANGMTPTIEPEGANGTNNSIRLVKVRKKALTSRYTSDGEVALGN